MEQTSTLTVQEENLKTATVLIVDDDQINRKITGKILQMWNIAYAEASSAMEAFEVLSSKSFALVLMDLQMPDIDGYEATKFIRGLNNKYFSHLPVIGFSANREEDVKHSLKIAGLNDYLAKPFSPERLKNILFKYNLLAQ